MKEVDLKITLDVLWISIRHATHTHKTCTQKAEQSLDDLFLLGHTDGSTSTTGSLRALTSHSQTPVVSQTAMSLDFLVCPNGRGSNLVGGSVARVDDRLEMEEMERRKEH